MSDVFSVSKRSAVMSLIRSRGNKTTEVALIALMRSHKITGWRRNQLLMGRPDFVFREHGIAVFVDGCFWHGCPACYREPKQNAAFWRAKISANRVRDKRVNAGLRAEGWKVVRLWEHELRRTRKGGRSFRRLLALVAAASGPSRKRTL